jgi:hypothetical protein
MNTVSSQPPGEPGALPGPQAGTAIRVASPAALLALVPQLLGFTPQDSLVVIGTAAPRGPAGLTLRVDVPSRREQAEGVARELVSVMVAGGFRQGVAAGYGPGSLVTPVADALLKHADDLGFRLTEVLRAEAGRYWSYLCQDPACCPAEGVPYQPGDHPVAAAFQAAGVPAPLAGREALAARIAAVTGADAVTMDDATGTVEKAAGQLTAVGGAQAVHAHRLDAVAEALALYRGGGQFQAGPDAAWLSVALRDLRARDDAWSRMDPAYREAHLRLWTDLTRLARPGYAAAPASLLAFVAWQSGNGALANVALDRAQADNPRYSMAALLREIIGSGAPPSRARIPLTPEEVAASYATAEDLQPEGAEPAGPGHGDGEAGAPSATQPRHQAGHPPADFPVDVKPAGPAASCAGTRAPASPRPGRQAPPRARGTRGRGQ